MIEGYDRYKACPVCKLDVGCTALSRVDNKTKICSFCGLSESRDTNAIKRIREQMKSVKCGNYRYWLEGSY